MIKISNRAQKAGPRSMCECAEGARSVRSGAAFLPQCSRDMQTLSHVRLHGLTPVTLTSLRCFSSVDWADEDAPPCSQARGGACCSGPLLTPCFASCSSLLIVLTPLVQ
ncbi:MAG: hypothetical protein ABFC71_03140 [Methanoregula sp.]